MAEPPAPTPVQRAAILPAFAVVRSGRARRPRLTIRPDGSLQVTLPARAPERWASELVGDRLGWIAHHRARILEQRSALAARPALEDGRLITLGGIAHGVRVTTAPAGVRRSRVVHDDLPEPVLRVALAAADPRTSAEVLEAWFRGNARATVMRRVAIRARDLGVQPAALAIRDQRSRWGSASRRGVVSISWRLVMAPAWVLDYVVVHELAHLLDFSHSARFWELVRRLVPESDAARRWLRAHDIELRHALD
ncbi:MAG: M48 family metallopeptidase [Candidatus Limnocylindrales bacterium]